MKHFKVTSIFAATLKRMRKHLYSRSSAKALGIGLCVLAFAPETNANPVLASWNELVMSAVQSGFMSMVCW
jgi:hypothetical protein